MSEKNSDKSTSDKSSNNKKSTDQDNTHNESDSKNAWETLNEKAIPVGIIIFISMVLFNQ